MFIKKSDIPSGWSMEAADFINKVRDIRFKHLLVPLA
jgi:hypothetical protein